jgi:hypothetical protein
MLAAPWYACEGARRPRMNQHDVVMILRPPLDKLFRLQNAVQFDYTACRFHVERH